MGMASAKGIRAPSALDVCRGHKGRRPDRRRCCPPALSAFVTLSRWDLMGGCDDAAFSFLSGQPRTRSGCHLIRREAGQSTETLDPISRSASPLTSWTLRSRRRGLLGLLVLMKVGQGTYGLHTLTIDVCSSLRSSNNGNASHLIDRSSDIIGAEPLATLRTFISTSAC